MSSDSLGTCTVYLGTTLGGLLLRGGLRVVRDGERERRRGDRERRLQIEK